MFDLPPTGSFPNEATLFGRRAVNETIAAIFEDRENASTHLARQSHIERQFCEWLFALYNPELVP